MTEEKQPMKTEKPMGLIALTVAILLIIGFLSTLKDLINDFVFIIMTFAGKTEVSFPGKAIGGLLGAALIIYCILKLLKYAIKNLSSERKNDQPKTTEELYTLKVYDLNFNNTTDHVFTVEKSLHPENGNVIWNTKFTFNGELIESKNHYFLSQSINDIRKIIEPKGFRILIKCADLDAAHSGMLADMSAGTLIYKLNEAKKEGKPNSYSILEASDINSVVSIEEQVKFREEFYKKEYLR